MLYVYICLSFILKLMELYLYFMLLSYSYFFCEILYMLILSLNTLINQKLVIGLKILPTLKHMKQ